MGFIGSQLGIKSFYEIPRGFPPIVPNAAVGFMIAAVSLFLLRRPRSRQVTRIAKGLAWAIIALGALTAVEYTNIIDFHLEKIFRLPPGLTSGAVEPGRMIPMAAVNFIIVGLALLKLDDARSGSLMNWSQRLSLFALLAPLVSLLSYLFGQRLATPFGPFLFFGIIPLPSAFVWLSLATGVLCSRPDVGIMRTLTQQTLASYSLRRFLIPILLMPPILIGLMQFGVNTWLFDPGFGSAVLAAGAIMFLTVVIWNTVSGVQMLEERANAATEAHIRSDMNLKLFFEVAPFGIVQVDSETLIFTRVNETFCAMTGYSQTELLGMTFKKLTHPDDFAQQWPDYQKLIDSGGGQFRSEKRYVRKDGTILWVIVAGVIFKDPVTETLRALAIVQDISDRKQEEQILLDARAAAEYANQMKSTFLANMSHELRTPLSAVTGFAEVLASGKLAASERNSYVNAILRNGRSLSRLIDDILDLSKVEAGKLDIERTKVSLTGVVTEVLDLLRPMANQKGIEIKSDLIGNVPAEIVTDPVRLRQILLNVIGNAVKFTAHGSVQVSVKRGEGSESSDLQRIEFWVEDTGKGLTATEQQRIFQPFSQADPTTTRKYGGTGLGLALSRQLARALGGDVQIASTQPGCGSVFLISIAAGAVQGAPPLQNLPSDVWELSRKRPTISRDLLHGKSILLAEDAVDVQLLIRTVLSKMGAKVTVANDGNQAIDRALEGNVDLVLMDLQMPELDGYGATRILREQGFRQPIIALTANAMKEDYDRSLAAGCDAHLAKPINIEVLGAVISKHLRTNPTLHS